MRTTIVATLIAEAIRVRAAAVTPATANATPTPATTKGHVTDRRKVVPCPREAAPHLIGTIIDEQRRAIELLRQGGTFVLCRHMRQAGAIVIGEQVCAIA